MGSTFYYNSDTNTTTHNNNIYYNNYDDTNSTDNNTSIHSAMQDLVNIVKSKQYGSLLDLNKNPYNFLLNKPIINDTNSSATPKVTQFPSVFNGDTKAPTAIPGVSVPTVTPPSTPQAAPVTSDNNTPAPPPPPATIQGTNQTENEQSTNPVNTKTNIGKTNNSNITPFQKQYLDYLSQHDKWNQEYNDKRLTAENNRWKMQMQQQQANFNKQFALQKESMAWNQEFRNRQFSWQKELQETQLGFQKRALNERLKMYQKQENMLDSQNELLQQQHAINDWRWNTQKQEYNRLNNLRSRLTSSYKGN